MQVFAWLIGFVFPLCSTVGAAGLDRPAPLDFGHLERPSTPNTALAAPAGFAPVPDVVTKPYALPPDQLYAAIRDVAASQPRVYPQINYDDRMQAHYVARSALWNFPDLVTVQVNADSTLVLWSRSIYGHSDLGANRSRITAWLDALDHRIARP